MMYELVFGTAQCILYTVVSALQNFQRATCAFAAVHLENFSECTEPSCVCDWNGPLTSRAVRVLSGGPPGARLQRSPWCVLPPTGSASARALSSAATPRFGRAPLHARAARWPYPLRASPLPSLTAELMPAAPVVGRDGQRRVRASVRADEDQEHVPGPPHPHRRMPLPCVPCVCASA